MTNDSPLVLYRERSATDVINATFQFLRAEFLPLAKGLLFLAGPALIVANVVALFAAGPQGNPQPVPLLAQVTLTLVGSVIAMAVTIGAVQMAHDEGGAALTLGRLWAAVRTHGLSLFGRQIQIGLILALVGALGALVTAGLMAVLLGEIGMGGGGSVVIGFAVGGVVFLLFLAFFLYAAPTFMLLFPGQVDPERSISLMRCVRLVKGRWGQTLGVWILATIITMVLFSVGWIPRFVMGALSAVGSNPTGTTGLVLAGVVSGVANTLAPAVTYTAITIQYYNLIEQKEQVSLEEDIGRIEQKAEAPAEDATEETDVAEQEAGGQIDAERRPPESEAEDEARWRGDAPNP